jgi:hypothetical protein
VTGRRLAAGCGITLGVLLLIAGCGIAKVYEELPAGERPDVDFRSAEIEAARARSSPTSKTCSPG